MPSFVVTCPKFTESLLAKELGDLGIAKVVPGLGAVTFEGTLRDGYRAGMFSRVGSRVLLKLKNVPAGSAEAFYEAVYAIEWEDHLRLNGTLAVDFVGTNHAFTNSKFGALKTKDAIVDRFRSRKGARPDVDTERPDVRVHVHVRNAEAQVAIDLSGSLHERGYRVRGAEAPLRENLAAAALLLAEWPAHAAKQEVLFDPMCGSGTLLIEGALMAFDIAPGLLRRHHACETWLGHEEGPFAQARQEAEQRRAAARQMKVRVIGSDRSAQAVSVAQECAKRAGISHVFTAEVRALTDVTPPTAEPGLLITNPPYGERLGDEAELGPLYARLGDVLKQRFGGWSANVLTGSPELAKQVGLRADAKHPLMNGPIECRLLHYPIRAPLLVKPAGEETAPSWRKPSAESDMFANRVRKNLRNLQSWAKNNEIHAYRAYDADIPEYNVTVDWYDGAVRLEEYEPPRYVDPHVATTRRNDVLRWIPELFGITPEQISFRVRHRRSSGEQHEKRAETGDFREVRESGMKFWVNLEDYLDTGLFLDDRNVRAMVRAMAEGKDVLNLFSYTCAISVAAVMGGARQVTSVDLSQTYLDWGERNFTLNDLDRRAHRFIRDDARGFLAHDRHTYGLIVLAPPTYSRSSRTDEEFDVQLDHVRLIEQAARRLTSDGVLLFTTNLRSFRLDERSLEAFEITDITAETTPPDFEKHPPHYAWRLTKR